MNEISVSCLSVIITGCVSIYTVTKSKNKKKLYNLMDIGIGCGIFGNLFTLIIDKYTPAICGMSVFYITNLYIILSEIIRNSKFSNVIHPMKSDFLMDSDFQIIWLPAHLQ